MITAIILAGGRGRRFNYQDKGLVEWRGKALIQHVIERIEPQVNQVIINSNRNLDRYRSLGFAVYEDQLLDFQGPLAGIQASLPMASHPLVLVCPCDIPLLPENLVHRLKFAIDTLGVDLAYPVCGQREHYLPVLMKHSLAPALDDYLTSESRSVKGWYHTQNSSAVAFENNAVAFSNFNSLVDLESSQL